MIYAASKTTVIVFLIFVAAVLGISFILGAKAKSARGYFAAHGQIHWFINGIAFAGDYLSAASFLGICGLIAFYGYDGFLYSIGFLAGWVVALFLIAEPIKRLGKYTFADALDSQFNSHGIKVTAAISTLIVSIFYLIPQMVGAGALVKPLLGLPYEWGVIIVGAVVILIVVTAGMVSTTWVQFIKGSLLVVFCTILTVAILTRGLYVQEPNRVLSAQSLSAGGNGSMTEIPATGAWAGKPYVRQRFANGYVKTSRITKGSTTQTIAQTITVFPDGHKLVNGLPQGTGAGRMDLMPVGSVAALPSGEQNTGAIGPVRYLREFANSTIVQWPSEIIKDSDGSVTTVYYQSRTKGSELLLPGGSPTFKGVKSAKLTDKLDFISLMLALFCGTASLPHILIRYYTVKDAAAARKSTIVGIASIGFFYVLTLFIGLGAMTSGALDVTNNNMAAPLLARSFGETLFAIISAIAFTTVLGTVSGLILAASGAVAHDLMTNFLKMEMSEKRQVFSAKVAAVIVGILAMWLGIRFQKLNVSFLVGWAFNVAASANLPALIMLLFWKRTTKQGITASIIAGLVSSLTWLLLSVPAYRDVYGWDPAKAPAPFSQPGLVTIPFGFLVLVIVSLMTPRRRESSAALMAGSV